MNEIPVIRKGSIKDYWQNGCNGGLLLGIIVFLASLMNNTALTSLYRGLAIWAGIIVIWVGIGFTVEEYFIRKKKIKKLNSIKYKFLDDNNFTLHPDLYFEGNYRGFYFRILPMTKWIKHGKDIEYIVIESFYTFDTYTQDNDREKRMCGNYFIGEVHFGNHCVSFTPRDWESPDFKENFDGLIDIFEREKLYPLFKDDSTPS